MAQDDQTLAQSLLHAAKKAGADAADAVVMTDDSLSIEVRSGALEHATRSEAVEAGLRVFVGQKQAVVSTSDLRPEMISELATRAVAMAGVAPDDPYCGLADPDQLSRNWQELALDLADPADPPSPDTLKSIALQAEAAALTVTGVSQVSDCAAGWSENRVHLAATNGFDGGYVRTNSGFHAVAIAGEGLEMERDYASESRCYFADLPDIDTVGRRAGERAVARQGAIKPPTGSYPILYDERVSTSLIGHLTGAANGSAVARGASWLKDRLGEAILPAGMTLTENPHRVRISNSRYFDGEGIPTAPRDIIADGV